MEEEEIDGEVGVADFHVHLSPDEREAGAELEHLRAPCLTLLPFADGAADPPVHAEQLRIHSSPDLVVSAMHLALQVFET